MENTANPILSKDQYLQALVHECRYAQRYQHFFTILHVHLVIRNDRPPHLRTTANLIRSVLRDTDRIGLISENEISVVLHYADLQNIKTVVSRIRDKIRFLAVRIGAACFPTNAFNAQGLLKEAQTNSAFDLSGTEFPRPVKRTPAFDTTAKASTLMNGRKQTRIGDPYGQNTPDQ